MLRLASSPFAALLTLSLLVGLAGCETLGFYSQAVSGQLSITHRRQPVAELLEELRRAQADAESQRLLAQLELSRDILGFADEHLGLDVAGRYQTFVQLDDPYVLWNVFAAPELALTPRSWCYLLVGCAPYRGYFARRRAQRYADKLAARGFDTYIGGVPAYSTLGWFADPLLSSFIYWHERDLAALLLHELAHGRVWVESDVAFNEAFATFVGRQGAQEFLSSSGNVEAVPPSAWPAMSEFLLSVRAVLEGVYARDVADGEKRAAKRQILAQARSCYADQRSRLGAGRFDGLMAGINNAYLVSLTTYQQAVPAFAAIFAAQGGDWAEFFAAVEALAELEPAERDRRVAALRQQQEANAGNDEGPQHIQCDALFGHGLDGEAAGAEDDDVGRGSHG